MSESKYELNSPFSFLTMEEFDIFIFHILFAILCGIVLLVPISLGFRLTLLVAIYIVAIPIVCTVRGYTECRNIWIFSLILSFFQFFPDWFLSAQLDILVFPEDNYLKIGTVSVYMAGLWTIPLFMIIFIGYRTEKRRTQNYSYLVVAIASLLIFGLSEQFLTISWHAQNVAMISNIAIYIIIPEILLGLTMYWMYLQTQEKLLPIKVGGAFIIMIIYLGNAAFFYFLLEKIVLQL
jgi:hypothetical protein